MCLWPAIKNRWRISASALNGYEPSSESELILMSDAGPHPYIILSGSERQLVPGAKEVGPSDPTEVIEVTIRLRPRESNAQIDAEVAALGAQLPADRTYLTPEQYAARYGADQADVAKVEQFAQESHLTVIRADLAQRVVVLSGPSQEISAAFRVQLVQYTSPQGNYRGRLGPVQIPAYLQGIVEGVFGLDNRLQARPHLRYSRPGGASEGTLATATAAPAFGTPGSFAPPQVGDIYNFPKNLDGSGQCIGILEFGGGYAESDLQTYFRQLNLPAPRVTAVAVAGVGNAPGKDPDSDAEVLLDIEIAASLAPGAKIIVYFAPFTEQGWVDVVNAAIHDTQNRPSVLSISWGYTEGQDIWTSQAIQTVNQAFQAAALQGITIIAAAGDDGSRDQLNDGRAHVDFPASSPYVLACGGTTLQFSGNNFTGEKVWNDGGRDQGGGATGGGVSDDVAQPAWQKGIVPPSVNPGNHMGRGVPDVAGNADGVSGYAILADGQMLSGVGGTSAVSPLWSALIARANQQLGKPVGYINPLLYSQFGKTDAFHDVTSGNNDPTGGQLGGYPAGAGWDACTGWGSPDGTKFVNMLTAKGAPISGGSASSSGDAGSGSAGGSAGAPSVPGDVVSSGSSSNTVGIVLTIIAILVVIAVIFFVLHGSF
jgi:kumamolisin